MFIRMANITFAIPFSLFLLDTFGETSFSPPAPSDLHLLLLVLLILLSVGLGVSASSSMLVCREGGEGILI